MQKGTRLARSLAAAVGLLLALGQTAQGDVFHMPGDLTSLDMVTVGNPGNPLDTRFASPAYPYYGNGTGFGAVPYEYRIGKFEVTTAQYCVFLNAVARTDTYGAYSPGMAEWCHILRSGNVGSYSYSVDREWANRPVTEESYWDACRFANWLENGSPTGLQTAATTEGGSYSLNGCTSYYGAVMPRNPGAHWAVASEDEWYKAAYYNPATGTYWTYPTQSNSLPISQLPPGGMEPPGSANHLSGGTGSYADPIHYLTEVGAYSQSPSSYGTFDQAGNASEWTENIPFQAVRTLRGGSFNSTTDVSAGNRIWWWPGANDYEEVGFRLVFVPEPATLALLPLGGLAVIGKRRK
ncbi:MAG: SUMF1/EgtB/PvdO family nonheme iron enzyme [Planctomycetota bacterium]|nr:SUMF1/EgtB/PvdO family nonheme iron enzyme [Planctomycetota bacterium]